MRGFREKREKIVGLLGGAFDQDVIEKFTLDRIDAIDLAPKTLTAAVVNAAEVVTTEQRGKLVDASRAKGSHAP